MSYGNSTCPSFLMRFEHLEGIYDALSQQGAFPGGPMRMDAMSEIDALYKTNDGEIITFDEPWGMNGLPGSPSNESRVTVVVDFEAQTTKGDVGFAKKRMYACVNDPHVVTTTTTVSTTATTDPVCPLPAVGDAEWMATTEDFCYM